MHLFSGQIDEAPTETLPANDAELNERVSALENEVALLKQQLQALLARGTDE
jgi:uncharacterized protein YceH (UPF0502 family)